MSDGGKGSSPRPFSIAHDEWSKRWDAIFQRDLTTGLNGCRIKNNSRKPLTDEDIYECERLAAIRHQRHKHSIRGQQITPADDLNWHFARAIEDRILGGKT